MYYFFLPPVYLFQGKKTTPVSFSPSPTSATPTAPAPVAAFPTPSKLETRLSTLESSIAKKS